MVKHLLHILYLQHITLKMTLEIITWNTVYPFNINVNQAGLPNPIPSNFVLEVWSQLSNTLIFTRPLILTYVNDRYWGFEFTLPSLEGNKHLNSMANYKVYQDGGLLDSGSLKLIYSPGGGTGTKDYISDNENREAVVYYTPDY